MTQIASLTVAIDVSAVDKANETLLRLVKLARLSEDAAIILAKSTRALMAGMDQAAASAGAFNVVINHSNQVINNTTQVLNSYSQSVSVASQSQVAATVNYGKASKAMDEQRKALEDLEKTVWDVGKAMADSEEPMAVLVDKAPDLAKSLYDARKSGLTFQSALSLMGGQLGEVAATLGPVGLGVAAVAAVFAGGLAVATDNMNKKFGDLTVGMGLTEEQLGRVKERGVTMGDTLQGAFDVVGSHLSQVFGPMLQEVGGWLGEMFMKGLDGLVAFDRGVIGGIGGVIGAIRAAWSAIPGVFMEFIINAANGVLGIVESMVNGIIDQINMVAGIVNKAAGIVGISPFSARWIMFRSRRWQTPTRGPART